jgi:predicted AlkP superfamily pyrophosphatase or phosphodiesterase
MLCIFIDALKPEYLREMPFLSSLKNESLHGYLEVPLGYTGIIASFVTGVWPNKHSIFDLFVPDAKPSKKIKNKYFLAFIRLLKNKRFFYTPLKIRSEYFKPSLDKTWPQKHCLSHATIFDLLESNGRNFEVIDWPNHFKNRKASIFFSKNYKKILQLTKKAKADFILTHFLDLEIAHRYGTESKQVIETAKNIDNAIKQIYNKDQNILVFSDHGMDNVEREVDVWKEIKKLNLRFGKDFLYIIGSTTVEFWFKNKEAKEKTTDMLKKLKYGKIIKQENFNIKTKSLIFLADFKTAFYPNFFSKLHFKAMHGWDPKQQKTYYILKTKGKRGKRNAKIVDFFPTILKIMALPKVKSDGKALL